MAQPAAATNLTNLFTDLHRCGQTGEFERGVKTANKILQEKPDDQSAFQCKIVCFIQLGRFEDALNAMRKQPKQVVSSLAFEKGYCEYRLNRTEEALKTLTAVPNPDSRIKELLGQALYRLERYDECFDTYKDLLKNIQDDYEEERETNLSAVMAALSLWSSTDVEEYELREDTYELCYNAACFLLGKGQYEQAVKKLKKAEELCRSTFAEDPDATDEDVDAELGIIRIQLGYTLQMLNRAEEASQYYNQVIKQRPSDVVLAAVASNNIVTVNKAQNVFDSKKKMKIATGDNLKHKMTADQQRTIALNQCLLFMYSNQGDQCRRTAQVLRKTYPENATPSLIEAAQYCRDKQVAKAAELLEAQMNNSGSDSLALKLTLAQLQIQQGHTFKACEILKSLGDDSHQLGMVSALVSLYLSLEDTDSAAHVLSNAITWHAQNKSKSSPETYMRLVRASTNFHLRYGSPKLATQLLEELRKKEPNDQKTLAQLIYAYSKFDPAKAQAISRELPAPENLADVDVDGLESSLSFLGTKYIRRTTKADSSPKPLSPKPNAKVAIEKKKHKKKKGKVPQNADPDSTPDPERWMAMRERSYYRGKRKNKRKDVGKGTQGATASAMDSLDASKPSPSASRAEGHGSPKPASPSSASSGAASGPSTPTPSSSQSLGPGPRQQKPSGKQKKKKKGGKW